MEALVPDEVSMDPGDEIVTLITEAALSGMTPKVARPSNLVDRPVTFCFPDFA